MILFDASVIIDVRDADIVSKWSYMPESLSLCRDAVTDDCSLDARSHYFNVESVGL